MAFFTPQLKLRLKLAAKRQVRCQLFLRILSLVVKQTHRISTPIRKSDYSDGHLGVNRTEHEQEIRPRTGAGAYAPQLDTVLCDFLLFPGPSATRSSAAK